jgi:hypothetical protein
MATITSNPGDQNTFQSIQLGGIPNDLPTIQSMPAGWNEVDGYRESIRSDSETQATRAFEGPWGNRLDFYTWCLGYRYNAAGGKLKRVIPSQHP